MEIKKLTFVERFIDEEPPEGSNHWRGIMAFCDLPINDCKDIVIFHIHYDEELSDFYIRTSLFPHDLIFNDIIGKTFTDKEEVKKEAQRLFEKIINMFLIKNT